MGQRAPESRPWQPPPPPVAPPLWMALLVAAGLFALLLSNGRPIGAGDTRPTERVAASLAQQGNLDVDEYPEVEPPFARQEGAHRVSIYPVLSAVMAAPVFAVAKAFFALDETGMALAGKVAASLFSALAAGVLFLCVGRRLTVADAWRTAAVFALGTSVWSTSQALWQHPAAVLFLQAAVLLAMKAEQDPAWAGRAGLPLALAVAARHADVAAAGVLAVAIALRWPRQIRGLFLWGLPGGGFVLLYQWLYFGSPWRHGFAGSLGRFSEPWGVGHAGLLVSPAKGLLVFTPVAAVAVAGLLRAFRRGERWLAGTLGLAALAHFALMGRWSEWHGGESWGPRLMTDALPLLFVFLPDGIEMAPLLGSLLVAVSVAVQALGAFGYDYRWERQYQRPPDPGRPELWRLETSPIPFYAGTRLALPSIPAVRAGRAIVREHPIVLFGPTGSRVSFAGERLAVTGADATFGDVHLQAAARLDGDKLRLTGRWDGLFLRVLPGARIRRLELRIAGRGRGTLYVGERSFWSDAPHWTAYAINGGFRLRHPYDYATSGGPDLVVTLGKSEGAAALDSVGLVPPGEPENVIEAP